MSQDLSLDVDVLVLEKMNAIGIDLGKNGGICMTRLGTCFESESGNVNGDVSVSKDFGHRHVCSSIDLRLFLSNCSSLRRLPAAPAYVCCLVPVWTLIGSTVDRFVLVDFDGHRSTMISTMQQVPMTGLG